MKFADQPPDKQVGPYKWNHQAHLGSGAFGKVYLGKDSNKGDQKIAIKVMDNKQIADPFLQQALKNEVDILKLLKGPQTVGLYDFLQTQNNTYIIQQFCNQGDFRHILTKKIKFDEPEAIKIFTDLLAGYGELVQNKLTHRDLKPENILVHDGIYKVADYGFGKKVPNYETDILTEACGTPLYMSPQIMKSMPYTTKSDVWSMGLIYYEMLYGRTPWPCNSLESLVSNSWKVPVSFPPTPKVSRESQNFIKNCLAVDEKKRFSWAQVLAEPMFQQKKLQAQLTYNKDVKLDEKSKQMIKSLQQAIANNGIDVNSIFLSFDKTGDKQLDTAEFTKLILTIDKSQNPKDVEALFKIMDTDKSGQIGMQEFKEIGLDVQQDADNTQANQGMLIKARCDRIIKNLCIVVYEKNIDIKKIFEKFDQSKDNNLDQKEFAQILKVIDETVTPQECQYVFQTFDTDKSNTITLKEFSDEITKGIQKHCSAAGNVQVPQQKVQLQGNANNLLTGIRHTIYQYQLDLDMLFKHFDADKSGTLDQKEFIALIKSLNARLQEQDYVELFKAFDKDGGGKIDLNEFKAALQ